MDDYIAVWIFLCIVSGIALTVEWVSEITLPYRRHIGRKIRRTRIMFKDLINVVCGEMLYRNGYYMGMFEQQIQLGIVMVGSNPFF